MISIIFTISSSRLGSMVMALDSVPVSGSLLLMVIGAESLLALAGLVGVEASWGAAS